ncbi:MAG: hypothetical protein CVU05_08180 [Bacteroidetes bacterium HGW-Bacteroidetes-21]|nr:MAG: hypothetical protein CVU05_08180 [Bacteroidetes bacterium HGW-Bacteroidetes-21]
MESLTNNKMNKRTITNEKEIDIKRKNIFSKLILFIVLFSILFVLGGVINGHFHFKDRKYYGIIEKIEYPENRRGSPVIFINTNGIQLSMEEFKIYSSLRVGDSIVKESGTTTIKLYHKEANGKWREMIFE